MGLSPAVKAMQDKLYHFCLSWLEKLDTFLMGFFITYQSISVLNIFIIRPIQLVHYPTSSLN